MIHWLRVALAHDPRTGPCMMGPAARLINGVGAALALGCAIVAQASPPASAVHWDAVGIGIGSILTAGSPLFVVVLRIWAAHLKDAREQARRDAEAERERKTRDHEMESKYAGLVAHNQMMELLAEERAERLDDLERELAESRGRLNEMAPRVRPPVEPLPPGPVERRVAESGQYPAVPDGGELA